MKVIRNFGFAALGIVAVGGAAWVGLVPSLQAQEDKRPVFKVKVDMVVLSFTVTDNKGRYINGLKPKDFRVLEDGIPQKFSTFAEGNKPPVQINEDGSTKPMVAEAGEGGKPGTLDATACSIAARLHIAIALPYTAFVLKRSAIRPKIARPTA